MLQGYLEAMRGDQVFDRLCRLLDGVSSLGQSAVEVGKFPANCVRNLGVRKPGNIVKISGDSRRFFDVVRDRKSTRLNSSHGYISYAVFCLKKKKKYTTNRQNTSHAQIVYINIIIE